MMRGTFIAAIALTALGLCSEPEQAPPIGAVRVHTTITDATLFVDAMERGPLRDGVEIQLAPGRHVLEARRDGAILATVPVEARSALIYDVQIAEASAPPIAAEPPEPPPQLQRTDSLSPAELARVTNLVRARASECTADLRQRVTLEVHLVVTGVIARAIADGGGDEHAELRSCIQERLRGLELAMQGMLTVSIDLGPGAPPVAVEPSSGPATPSRGDIVSAMNAVSTQVAACGNGEHGIANVRIEFASSGRVTNATIAGGSFPAPVASCIARAARQARVPPFTQPTFSVNYPFRL